MSGGPCAPCRSGAFPSLRPRSHGRHRHWRHLRTPAAHIFGRPRPRASTSAFGPPGGAHTYAPGRTHPACSGHWRHSGTTAHGEAASILWVKDGLVVTAEQLAQARGLTRQASEPAADRSELLEVKVGDLLLTSRSSGRPGRLHSAKSRLSRPWTASGPRNECLSDRPTAPTAGPVRTAGKSDGLDPATAR